MINKVFAGVMIVSGLLTITMLYAAVSPLNAMMTFFGEDLGTPAAAVVVANWGILIALMGALLIYGALHPPSRKLALVVAGASKIAFIWLVLAQGDRYLAGLGTAVIIDSVMVALFAAYVIFGKPTAAA
jgi:hypothetical protein